MLDLLSNARTAIRTGKASQDICSMTAWTKEPRSQRCLPQQGRTIKSAMGLASPRMIPKTLFLRVFTVYFSCFHPEALYTHNRIARDVSEERTPLWKLHSPPPGAYPGKLLGPLQLSCQTYTIQWLFPAGNRMFQRQLDLLLENGGGEVRWERPEQPGLSILNPHTHSQIQTS